MCTYKDLVFCIFSSICSYSEHLEQYGQLCYQFGGFRPLLSHWHGEEPLTIMCQGCFIINIQGQKHQIYSVYLYWCICWAWLFPSTHSLVGLGCYRVVMPGPGPGLCLALPKSGEKQRTCQPRQASTPSHLRQWHPCCGRPGPGREDGRVLCTD